MHFLIYVLCTCGSIAGLIKVGIGVGIISSGAQNATYLWLAVAHTQSRPCSPPPYAISHSA